MNGVSVKKYGSAPYQDKEILRYLCMRGDSGELHTLLDECKALCRNAQDNAVCYTVLPVTICNDTVDFDRFSCVSRDLAKTLCGCNEAILFVATAGFGIDRLIKKYATVSPARAFVLSAIGSERAETLCDTFCQDMKEQYGDLRPRYSPGYGDLPLTLQTEVFRVLGVERAIGVTLGESLLMTPSKSVSAIIGIGGGGQPHTCDTCRKPNCMYNETD